MDVVLRGGEAALSEYDTDVPYIERIWSGTEVTSTGKTRAVIGTVPANGAMTSGWYYLNSSVTVKDRICLKGDTNLILGDGYTLDVKGLYVPEGITLTIYARSDGDTAGRIYSHPGKSQGGSFYGLILISA